MTKIAIIIPTYNEAENIESLVHAILSEKIEGLEILIVDDNSPDGTGEIAERLSTHSPITLLKREKKLGLGTAYVLGFKEALKRGAELIFEMDADFSHSPKDLPRLIKAAGNYDVVIGSRRIAGGGIVGWNIWRHFASSSAMWLSRLVLGLRTRDVTSGFRCYQKIILEKINLDKITSNGYAFQEEMIWRCEQLGARVKEVPITFVDRQYGKSKVGVREIIDFFVTIWKLKRNE